MFDNIWQKDPDKLFQHMDDIKEMADHLADHGLNTVAQRTRLLLSFMALAIEAVAREQAGLKDVWYHAERHVSGKGFDYLKKAAEVYVAINRKEQ